MGEGPFNARLRREVSSRAFLISSWITAVDVVEKVINVCILLANHPAHEVSDGNETEEPAVIINYGEVATPLFGDDTHCFLHSD